jgi:hypothetical protein
MTTPTTTIMSTLYETLRGGLTAHPHLCPIFLESVLRDESHVYDMLREFTVRIFRDVDGGYCVMSPLHEDGWYVGVFVGLDWLSNHAQSTREQFDEAYEALGGESSVWPPPSYQSYLAAKLDAILDDEGPNESNS